MQKNKTKKNKKQKQNKKNSLETNAQKCQYERTVNAIL